MTASQTRTVLRHSLCERLRVHLFGRVLMVTVFLAAAGSLTLLGGPKRDLGTLTFWVIAAAYAGTIASALLVRRVARAELLAYLQVVFDVLLLTGAIALVGHVEGPWILLYVLPITSAAGLLMLPGAFTAAGLSTVAYGVVIAADGYGFWELALWISFAGLAFAGVAALMGSLSRRLDSVEDELQQRERDMNRLEDVHRALAHGLECGVLVVGANEQVRSANPASQQILGLTTSGMVGRDIHWLMPCLRSAESDAEGAGSGPVECEHRAGDGSTRRLRVKRGTLRDTYGNHCGSLLIVQDVTHLLELEARVANDSDAVLRVDASGGDASGESSEPAVEGLIGSCASMRGIAKLIDKVADADATVLITGESGTGKEVVARAIHNRSTRKNGPFVVVNCGAIPENLIESELFGHVRGAFTGAVADRPGLFRRAHGGTIFLDEVGELPLALQVRLLRVLQDRTVMPVGGGAPVAVDVRVLAATNRVLEDLVKAAQYREDLYYRLAVISIEMPPLRERGKDLELLIEHFVRKATARHGKRVEGVSGRAMQLLLRYGYPGNVRELENVIEHAATLTEGPTIREVDLPDSVRDGSTRPRSSWSSLSSAAASAPETPILDSIAGEAAASGVSTLPQNGEEWPGVLLPVDEGEGTSLDDQLARREKEMLLAALSRASGVKKRAATLLGINYRSFRHRLQKYGLDSHGDEVLPRFGAELPRESGH